jgi:hypothetical protein
MAAVNACFQPDEGAAATHGEAQLQQPASGTSPAQSAQQGEGSSSGNNRFDTTNEISCTETPFLV